MPDEEFESAQDEAYFKGMQFMSEWDYILADIEEKWGLPRGSSLDEYILQFKGS